jgi:hypothetical protein
MTETDVLRLDATTIRSSQSCAKNSSQFVRHIHTLLTENRYDSTPPGGVAEWSNAPDLKSGMPARASWVRIPPPPFSFVSLRTFL